MSEGQAVLVILLLAGILIALWPALLVWVAWGLGILIVLGVLGALRRAAEPRRFNDREWEEWKRGRRY